VPDTGDRGEKDMKKKISYKDAPADIREAIETGEVVMDLIPGPDQLIRKKKPITIRVDDDVLNWFKTLGKGYQTRINAILRSYMQTHQK
jgi:uncharacterized protein (DUF4415 family)